MKSAELQERGAQLIKDLKTHIQDTLIAFSDVREGTSLHELQEFAGLVIRGRTGQNVWDKAFATLVIELVKENRVRSSIPLEQLNTTNAMKAHFRPR